MATSWLALPSVSFRTVSISGQCNDRVAMMNTPNLYGCLALPACSYSSLSTYWVAAVLSVSTAINGRNTLYFTELLWAEGEEGVSLDQHGIICSQILCSISTTTLVLLQTLLQFLFYSRSSLGTVVGSKAFWLIGIPEKGYCAGTVCSPLTVCTAQCGEMWCWAQC